MLKRQKKVVKSARNYVNILGVRLDSTSMVGVLNTIGSFLANRYLPAGRQGKFSLFTANPELLVMATKDKTLKKIINSADLVIPDGVGLKLAIPTLPIIKGRELFLKLVSLAKKENRKVFFLGGKGIKNVFAGPVLDENGEPKTTKEAKIQKEVIQKINEIKPDLLFVGFGMPKQEKWIFKNLPTLEVGGAMAVGGTFDYVFGQAKLPPEWLEKLGLEWLWRLLHEPKRVFRIIKAVVVFPIKVIWSSIFRISCH